MKHAIMFAVATWQVPRGYPRYTARSNGGLFCQARVLPNRLAMHEPPSPEREGVLYR